jgi:hypothetical protein
MQEDSNIFHSLFFEISFPLLRQTDDDGLKSVEGFTDGLKFAIPLKSHAEEFGSQTTTGRWTGHEHPPTATLLLTLSITTSGLSRR